MGLSCLDYGCLGLLWALWWSKVRWSIIIFPILLLTICHSSLWLYRSIWWYLSSIFSWKEVTCRSFTLLVVWDNCYIGLIFFGLLLYQHFKGIKGWSPDYKVSSNLILFGRILAATGWLIHEEDKMYAFGVLGISVLLYTMVERKPELMTKGKWSTPTNLI